MTRGRLRECLRGSLRVSGFRRPGFGCGFQNLEAVAARGDESAVEENAQIKVASEIAGTD
jgi:hypothetical protein